MYKWTKDEVLKLTLKELLKFSEDAWYWKMDELGIKYKRPLSQDEQENKKERDAQLKAQYATIRAKADKG